MKFDVELFGIPLNKDVGQEVTINFHSHLKNNGTFYTDSNALEMQHRQLNERPDWILNDTYKYAEMNITANYYPINSAIAIRDGPMQMTVMNDRSQGGSSLVEGRIELMQNRRSNVDDGRGVDEPLNETDTRNNSITVPATYYL